MDMDKWRLQARTALHEQGTLLEIARIILAFASDMDDLTLEISREIVERHRYDHLAIYMSRRDGRPLTLTKGHRLGERLTEREATALVNQSAERSQELTDRNGDSWRVAIPIEDGSTTLGVLVAGSVGSDADAGRACALCKALSRLIALGIQNSSLRRQQLELALQQERGRIDCETHDRVG